MEQITDITQRGYYKPCVRTITTFMEQNYLASNTEPIDDDGNEHDWD